MNVKSTLTLGIAALATASFASAQDIPGATVINITGATAFRSASHTSLVALLGGNGVTQYAYTGNSGLSGANRSIFSGTIGGQPYIIRCSWSGSTEGIKAVADATGVELLTTANTRTTGGMNLGQGANPAPAYENGIPRFSFSDVDKALSERPNAPLSGGPVGVVPFMFVAGFSAPAGMTNMTDQVHEALWSVGQGPLSLFTGNPNDTTIVLPTGRNNGSGTRATILAETGYGPFRSIAQWNSTFTGNRGSGSLAALSEFGNNGHTSNSGVRDLLTRDSSNVTLNGDAFSVIFVSYLTISDAVAATGYNQLTGTISGGEGAKPMTYNGVRFSEENVKNGSYTLWGYQQFYRVASATAAELTFDTALRNTIPNNMGSAGIPLTQMHVSRAGGDGGLVQPLGE